MSNTGYGLIFSRTLHGGQPLSKRFYIPSTNATALFKGDAVMLTTSAGTMDPLGEVPTITQFVSGDVLLGVVDGFEVDSSQILTGNYRPASTNRYVNVIVDPDACYYALEDAVGGAATQAQIGAMNNFNLNIAAGSTYTGYSGHMIQSSSATTSAADVKVIGIRADGVETGAQTNGCDLEVMILSPAMKATASHS